MSFRYKETIVIKRGFYRGMKGNIVGSVFGLLYSILLIADGWPHTYQWKWNLRRSSPPAP